MYFRGDKMPLGIICRLRKGKGSVTPGLLGKCGLNADLEGASGSCWIPGGKKLAFLDGSSTRIFLVSLSDGEVTELATDDPDLKDWIYPSPDGKWISYVVEGWVRARAAGTIWKVKVEDLAKGK
jgi:hypothetical protein